MLHFHHGAAALGARGKTEVNPLSFGRYLDRHDLLEHLDPALYLRRLRRLVTKPVDEHLDARDLFVLIAFGLSKLFEHRVALLDVLAVVADVVGQPPQVNVGDPRDDGIEEVTVVRDEDDGVRIGMEIFLEPVACLEIEVIGRLVEQQQVWTSEQQLCEGDSHLPAARERFARTVAVLAAESEAAQHGRDAQVDAIALVQAESILKLRVAREHRIVFVLRDRGITELVLDVVHLRLHVEQRLKRAACFLEDRSSRVAQAVLRQVTDREPGRLHDAARIGVFDSAQNLEEGRLSGAVRAAQADAFAVADLPRHVIEQDAVAEGFREVGKLDHAGRAPRALAAAASTWVVPKGFVRYPATPRFSASIALDSVE